MIMPIDKRLNFRDKELVDNLFIFTAIINDKNVPHDHASNRFSFNLFFRIDSGQMYFNLVEPRLSRIKTVLAVKLIKNVDDDETSVVEHRTVQKTIF